VASDATYIEPQRSRAGRWRIALGIAMSAGALVLAYLNRQWLGDAIGLVRAAKPLWLLAALAIILGGYCISSQVFQVVLRSLGYRVGPLRLWATALVAIVASQSFPAGGVASYAFLLRLFKRQGVSSGEAALVAALEAFSYAGAMLIFASFGLVYLAGSTLSAGAGALSLAGPLLAGLLALLLLGGAAALLTQPPHRLASWLLALNRLLARALRRPLGDAWVHNAIGAVARGRELIAGRRRLVTMLVLIQVAALASHSLALLVILHSLGAPASPAAVFAAFGLALLTSTFNVLPGGGGTVETVLVVTLTQLGAGAAAVPGAILFRLLNFWAMLPLAGISYALLSRGGKGDTLEQ
jgi:uncharacterized protein (TIRG00374 family)